jgi:glycosyltransferase involved in cell wall biosynthesis
VSARADDISVVIPAYNAAAYLAEAVRSVCDQTLPPKRIIVVDDGSTDATAEVAVALQRSGLGPEIEVILQANGGPAAALNRGAALVENGLIAFQAADDIWVPEKTRWQLQALDEGADLVFGHGQNFISPDLDAATAASLHCPPHPMPCEVVSVLLTRVETFRAVGWFDERVRIGESLDWLSRAADLGLKSVILPQVVAYRRLHGRNFSLTRRPDSQEYLQLLKAMLDRRRASARTQQGD